MVLGRIFIIIFIIVMIIPEQTLQAVIVSQIQGERDSNLVWQGIIIILQVPAATLNSLVHKSLMKRLSVRVCNLHLLIHAMHQAGI